MNLKGTTDDQASIALIPSDLSNFRLAKVLWTDPDHYLTCVLGTVNNQRAILLIKKQVLPRWTETSQTDVDQVLLFEEIQSSVRQFRFEPSSMTVNDKFSNGTAYCVCSQNNLFNRYHVQMIIPATDDDVAKYQKSRYQDTSLVYVEETPELYHKVVRPIISQYCSSRSLDWVYNILEKKKESEHIIFEDPDPMNGFIMLPDFKWDNKSNIDSLYCLGICHDRNLFSIRELNASHLPLLENMLNEGARILQQKYGVARSQLRIFLHYQPSFYHLHVHYTHVNLNNFSIDRCHMLHDVIDHLRMIPDYFQRKTLYYTVPDSHDIATAISQYNHTH